MPRIADQFTDVAVYIYRCLADAKEGERVGGSGFLVHMNFDPPSRAAHPYCVTNRHVIVEAKNPVIRINRKDSSFECIPTKAEDWTFHPDGDDVAVMPFETDYTRLKMNTIPSDIFITPKLIEDEDIGIGDDTVMVGRFINHEGRQQNTPAVRFGNIAMMAKEKIVSETGLAQESFLVEIRSLPGYSGSAVFIYSPCAMNDMSQRRYGHDRVKLPDDNKFHMPQKEFFDAMNPKGPYLLGIDFCHIHTSAKIRDRSGAPLEDGWIVLENTGMAGVIPAWKIREVLAGEDLAAMRRRREEVSTQK